MYESTKVRPQHLEREAYLYVRQSCMKQVLENTESTKRQYGLRERAKTLGWAEDRIVVIDSDQGESGASATWRDGFRRLVTEVGMGRVGIVMGLEVSRLARNNADWHRLLEICAFADTLILDEDGVYDPTSFNDRLLLGLKGTMSEAELHVLKARLRGGIMNKVRRGEYRFVLPTGFVYDEAGEVVLDPDLQVRETIAYFFEMFTRVGSVHQAVKAFAKENLKYPSRICTNGHWRIVFRPLTASTAMRTLQNPRYAGVYSYGRRRYRRTADGKKTNRRLDQSAWTACIQNSHPGYITWDQYQANLKLLAANGKGYGTARRSPPREGSALLQGRAVCGRCGQYMSVRYRTTRGHFECWYVCDRASSTRAEPNCQSIAGGPVDEAVGVSVASIVTPAAVDLALEIRREIEVRQQEADQLRSRAVERAHVEADMAQRRFMMVDPNNRLVANSLETEWNDKLRALDEASSERERCRKDDLATIDNETRQRLVQMTTDFKSLWSDTTTPNRERKRLLAHVIDDVTLVKVPSEGLTNIHIRFKGGKTETLTTQNPKSSAQIITTRPEIVQLVDDLLDHHIYAEIAEILNERGFRPGGAARSGRANARFTALRVAYVTNTYGLRSRYARLRERGMMTSKEIAAKLNVHEQTVIRWAKYGLLTKHAYNGHFFLYEDPGPDGPTKHSSRWDQLTDRAAARIKDSNPDPSRRSDRTRRGAV